MHIIAMDSLSDESRKMLVNFGSQLITKMTFRDSFVMVGQRGLALPAKAIEKVCQVLTMLFP